MDSKTVKHDGAELVDGQEQETQESNSNSLEDRTKKTTGIPLLKRQKHVPHYKPNLFCSTGKILSGNNNNGSGCFSEVLSKEKVKIEDGRKSLPFVYSLTTDPDLEEDSEALVR